MFLMRVTFGLVDNGFPTPAWSPGKGRDGKDVMMNGKYCDNCKFYGSQSCHRHAPVLNNHPGEFPRPVWPYVEMHDWCGDWEAIETPDTPTPPVGGMTGI